MRRIDAAPRRQINSGTITGGGDGVSITGGAGAATNTGTISGNDQGVYFNSNSATFTNAGAITGATDSVVFAGSGANTLTLQTGSMLNGAAVGSEIEPWLIDARWIAEI